MNLPYNLIYHLKTKHSHKRATCVCVALYFFATFIFTAIKFKDLSLGDLCMLNFEKLNRPSNHEKNIFLTTSAFARTAFFQSLCLSAY